MSTIKGNNEIDDLFRRASDRYPLRTDSSDWDRMVADLDSDPSLILPPVAGEGGQRRRRWVFWLWLLLPLAGIGYYTGHRLAGGKDTVAATKPSEQTAVTKSGTETAAAEQLAGGPTQAGTAAGPGTGVSEEKGTTTSSGSEVQVTPGLKTAGEEKAVSEAKTVGQPVGGSMQERNGTAERGKIGSTAGTGGDDGSGLGRREDIDKGGTTGADDGAVGGEITGQPGVQVIQRGSEEVRAPYAYAVPRAQTKGSVATNVRVTAPAGDTASKAGKSPKAAAKKQKTPHFYAGILVAPDLSLIKFQAVKGVGTTFGLLVGYSFNRKWAIETGASLDTKKYYTEGRYYKTEGYLPPSDTLTDVNGVCHMIEVPINLRYNLGQGPLMKWFVTTGFSNYFMSKQSYAYDYQNNGYLSTHYYTDKKPAQYWFSIVNLSLGYEQKLGKIGELRIEPYARIPLSGIGLGSLPIMSTGVNIGFTHRFR